VLGPRQLQTSEEVRPRVQPSAVSSGCHRGGGIYGVDAFPVGTGPNPQTYPFDCELLPSGNAGCQLGRACGTHRPEPPASWQAPRDPEVSLVRASEAAGCWPHRCKSWRELVCQE